MAGLHVRAHVVFAYTAAGILYGVASVLLAGVRINIDPAFGSSYLLAPIAAVVIAGVSLSGGADVTDEDETRSPFARIGEEPSALRIRAFENREAFRIWLREFEVAPDRIAALLAMFTVIATRWELPDPQPVSDCRRRLGWVPPRARRRLR